MWVLSHIKIKGNEIVDDTAYISKQFLIAPFKIYPPTK